MRKCLAQAYGGDMTTATAPSTTLTALSFEREDACTRCGGSGRMPFSAYGGVCFRCNGQGSCLTAKGKRAQARLLAWQQANYTFAASAVPLGYRIRDSYTGRREAVQSRETTLGQGGGRSMTGVEGTDSYTEIWTYGRTELHTARMTFQSAAHAPTLALPPVREYLDAVAAWLDSLPARSRNGFVLTYS